MLTLNRLETSNPNVKAFHVLQDGAVVGLVVEECRNEDGTSDWDVSRLINYGLMRRLCNRSEAQMIEEVNSIPEKQFLESRDYCHIQITTGFGRRLYLAVRDDEEVISAVHRETFRGRDAKLKINDPHFVAFVRKYLLSSGDWPVSIGAVREDSVQIIFKREFEAPALHK